MVPGLGDKFDFEIEMVEKTRDEYRSKAYAETKQPIAPAIMIDGDVIVVQKDISLSQLEKIIESRI